MDEPCDICGDIGVVDVIATCSQCKVSREHVYCMTKYREDFPLNWLCGACESTCIISSSSSVKEDLPRTVELNFSNMMHHDSKASVGYTKHSRGARGNWCEKEVGKGKTKYLWTQEVIKMPSGDKKGELTSRVCRLSSSPSKSVTSTMGMAQMKRKSITPANSSCKVKGNHSFGPFRSSGHLNPPRPGNTRSNPLVQKLKEKNAILHTTKEHAQNRQTKPAEDIETTNTKVQKEMGKTSCSSPLSSHCQPHGISEKNVILSPAKEHAQRGQTINALTPAEDVETTDAKMEKAIDKASCASLLSIYCELPVLSGGNFTKNAEPKNFDAKNRSAMGVVPTIEEYFPESTIEEKLPTDPAPNASWKGSFKLKDEETSDGFWAHHPSKVRRKVYEFSKKMPEVIEFELLPCQDFLMDLFHGDCPDKDDIGLYFFPCNRSKKYISLLEHLSEEELVMRSFIDGVELLVFTSKVLYEDCCKWSKYDFLWGLYRCLKLDIARCTLDFNGIRENNMVVDMDIDIHDADSNAIVKVVEEVDMEIDMVGGKSVGTLDNVISKESVESSCGISGAEATTIVLPNANITAVSGKIHPSLVIKKEICDDIPLGFGVSSREMGSDIPPGFGVSSSQMCSDIPPGFAVPIKIKKPALFSSPKLNYSPVQDFSLKVKGEDM